MSLDLSQTAMQIDGMARHLQARHGDWERRLERAVEAAASVPDAGDSHGAPPTPPADFCVAAVDGSHIDVDRHVPGRSFLINSGVAVLTYGSRPDARLSSRPRLYARDDELVIRDDATYREQPIEGAVLGAKRTVEEIKALAQVVAELPKGVPTLALMDGSLVMLGLVGLLNQDFVLRELVEEGFVGALEQLRSMAEDRPLAVASYISLPGHAEVVRDLREMVCSYDEADDEYRCGLRGPGRRPCGGCIGGVLDRDVYSRLLEPGERSAVFPTTTTPAVARYYQGNDVHFFYVNVGEEVGRVEVPSWVAEDGDALGLVHSLIVDQCHRGGGYPVGLMEAHEQAVVTGADRRYFVQLMEQAFYSKRLPLYTSEKARSKSLRRL
jgi:GNAT superfamily N-acetyltransferase